jgi:xanthine dehydrogenase small subunit
MNVRSEIHFVLSDTDVALAHGADTDIPQEFLRNDPRMTGTTGACIILVGRLQNRVLRLARVNAHMRLAASVDTSRIVTFEHCDERYGHLYPPHQCISEHHSNQYGFCTPGFIMSLYAQWMANPTPITKDVKTPLQGNLWHSLDYAPIAKAALANPHLRSPANDALSRERMIMMDLPNAALAAGATPKRVSTAAKGVRAAG